MPMLSKAQDVTIIEHGGRIEDIERENAERTAECRRREEEELGLRKEVDKLRVLNLRTVTKIDVCTAALDQNDQKFKRMIEENKEAEDNEIEQIRKKYKEAREQLREAHEPKQRKLKEELLVHRACKQSFDTQILRLEIPGAQISSPARESAGESP